MSGSSGSGKRGSKGHRSAPTSGSLYERYKDALRRGHVAALRGRNDAAVDAYGEAASIAPDRALPHVSVGGILAKMNRLDDAVAAFERALALAPRDEGALRGIADVHVRTGRRTEAAAALDRLADSLDAAGRLADATDAARRALELAESRSRRHQVEGLVGRLRSSSVNDEAARRALDQALRLLAPPAEPADHSDAAAPIAAAPTLETEPEATDELATASADTMEPGVEARIAPQDALAEVAEPELEAGAALAGATPEDAVEPPVVTDGAVEAPTVDVAGAESGEEPAAEPAGLGIALGALAETALHAGDPAAREHLLAAARAHRRAGRTSAALDACDLAIGIAPSDVDVHLLLADLYLDRGWRVLAIDKLLLLGRLAELDDDRVARERLCALVTERLPDEPRVAALCA